MNSVSRILLVVLHFFAATSLVVVLAWFILVIFFRLAGFSSDGISLNALGWYLFMALWEFSSVGLLLGKKWAWFLALLLAFIGIVYTMRFVLFWVASGLEAITYIPYLGVFPFFLIFFILLLLNRNFFLMQNKFSRKNFGVSIHY